MMMNVLRRLVLSFLLSASLIASASAREPTVALVLSGGGAAGVAHVGVIKALERLGVRPDIVTGTSMGAIIGGLYASGFTPEDLERAVTEVDWTRILDDASERDLIQPQRRDSRLDPLSVSSDLPIGLGPNGPQASAGLVDGVKLGLILRQLTLRVDHIDDFDDFPIRFRAVATDLLTAAPVVIGDGDLSEAMRASMSIPGLFPPVERDGHVLVDGGVTNNLPIDVARDLGADVIIASFVPPATAQADDVSTLTGALGRSLAIFIHARSRVLIDTLSDQDVLLVPAVEDVGMLSFEEAPDTITAGVDAVRAQTAALAALGERRPAPSAWPSIGDTAGASVAYDAIEVVYDGRLDPRIIRRRFGLPDSGTATIAEIEVAARRVYGLELFESVTYRLEQSGERRILVLEAVQKNQGFLRPRIGVNFANAFGDDSDFTLAAGVSLPELNRLGGRADIDFAIGDVDGVFVGVEQPLDLGLTFFIGAQAAYFERSATLYSSVDDPSAEIDVDTFFSRLNVVWSPGDWGGVGAFTEFQSVGVSVDVGALGGVPSGEVRDETVLVGVALDYDTLDDVDLPTRGVQIGAEFGVDVLDDDSFGAIQVDALAAASFGRHTVSPYAYVSGEIDASGFNPNFIGGARLLPGFDQDELAGDVVAATGVRYYYRADFIPYFGSEAFVGGSIAYGGAFEDWSATAEGKDGFLAGSAFAGIETLFGPAILSFGAAEQGQYATTLTLGSRF